MDNDAYVLLSAIAGVHRLMKEHASELRMCSGVRSVTHWFDIYNLDGGSRLEEFVDAEFLDGEAISWRLELTSTSIVFAIEADIRRNHKEGQDVVAEIADRIYSTAKECSTEILEITRQLVSTDPISCVEVQADR